MTSEQLAEIEKLSEAATPGPWATKGESWEEVEGEDDYQPIPRPYTLIGLNDKALWSSGGGEYAYPDDATAYFIVAMREHALPLVQAVRDAREKKLTAERRFDEMESEYLKACKERDYERAVNAKLCAALERIANPAAIGSAFHEEAVAIARRAL